MAFTTLHGASSADKVTYLGTESIDAIVFTNTSGNQAVEALGNNDSVTLLNSGSALYNGLVINSSFKLGAGVDNLQSTGGTVTTYSGLFANGNAGADVINFGANAADAVIDSTIMGGNDADTITTSAATTSKFNGNKGADTLTVSRASTNSSAFGGQGLDSINISAGMTGSIVSGDNGNDRIVDTGAFNLTSTTVKGGIGDDVISLSNINAGTGLFINGNGGNDNISGAAVATVINGGGGNDGITGGAGNDSITGGAGDDNLVGAGGIDTFTVDQGTDTLTDLGNGGSDVFTVARLATFNATVTADYVSTITSQNLGTSSLTAANGIDINVSALSSAAGVTHTGFTITGDAGQNEFIGSVQTDTISSGAAVDTITSSGGNDQITGGAAADIINLGAGTETMIYTATGDYGDVITSFSQGTDILDLSAVAVSGTGFARGAAAAVDFGTTGMYVVNGNVAAATDNLMTAAEVETAFLTGFGGVDANETIYVAMSADVDTATDSFVYRAVANAGGTDIASVDFVGEFSLTELDNFVAADFTLS